MSSKKPGVFGRLRRAISSTINDAVDSISDPGQEVALMLDDLAAQIDQTEKDLKQAMVDRKVMERKLEEQKKDEAAWSARAEQAVKLGDDKLARAALERKTEATAQRKDAEAALVDQRRLVDEMHAGIRESKSKLKSLNLRRGSLMAQARALKTNTASSGGIGDGGAGERMDEIEAKIAHIEAMNEVAKETMGSRAEEAEVDAKLAELEGESELDDELERLKAKMATKAALKEADEDSS